MRIIENFKDYQYEAMRTAVYPNIGKNIIYPILGLCGEAGEVANAAKKILRDDNGKLTQERKEKLIDELGDCLWYIAATCNELGIWIDDLASMNVNKLSKRKKENTIHGDKREEIKE